ncbi:TRAP-type transport system permease protein (plasmid) [Natrialba magadii ATCC 43099]|uniref:TRAP-type transport system permease protein n=2 Tax=Natrialba magadii (strain ATCC 43099 / DSM 3394 / CCM 3739 / CIP 104546 / IAM 13178 / JCM 8861 / NBRC 102185 / NCIMB 2190 / MS3) TaxID=547559 RepID=D3T1U6_NATMM|nr:TRAP transporter fused permease subunit [Natrialba magadii]ADD07555.1 TRAP-type transport system permease protein [Natrialba magadii ATCC 43099]
MKLKPSQLALTLTAIALWAWVIAYALWSWLPRAQYTITFIGLAIFIYLLDEYIGLGDSDGGGDTDASGNRRTLHGLFLAAIGAVTAIATVYLYANYNTLVTTRVGYALDHELLLAAVFAAAVIYLTYRAFGLAFVGVILFAIGYGYFGPYFPGVLTHSGFSETRILNIMVLEIDGFYGELSEIVAAWVAPFLLYAGLLKAYGAFDLIIRVAFRSATVLRSGVAQSAVIASLVIGSINGSQTANAAMTGSFTIPLMKNSGMKSETAGGIESVASTGGQIMPPVMGAAAFVMASLLGITYIEVVIAGLIPAAIFFFSVAAGVHYTWISQSGNAELNVSDHIDEVKSKQQLAVEGVMYAVPLIILIYLLGVLQWTVMTSALYTVISMIVLGVTVPVIRATQLQDESPVAMLRTKLFETVDGFREGAIILAPIVIIIAAVNGIVDVLVSTGIPGILSLILIDLSGGSMFLAVLIAMVVCILLGLGMPTVAAYSLVALLIAPALVSDFAVPDLAAHYFVLYAAILSGITPPIAIAVVVAAGVAKANFWRTSLEALKLAAPLYVLPFAFIYNPEIVVGGISEMTLVSGGLALLGAISIIHGLNYYRPIFGMSGMVNIGIRGVYVLLGVVIMVVPSLWVRLGALGVAAFLYTVQWRGSFEAGSPAVAQGD